MLNDCMVSQILPSIFDKDKFSGYYKMYDSFEELELLIKKSTWRTALQNQKKVYLQINTSNSKNISVLHMMICYRLGVKHIL